MLSSPWAVWSPLIVICASSFFSVSQERSPHRTETRFFGPHLFIADQGELEALALGIGDDLILSHASPLHALAPKDDRL